MSRLEAVHPWNYSRARICPVSLLYRRNKPLKIEELEYGISGSRIIVYLG